MSLPGFGDGDNYKGICSQGLQVGRREGAGKEKKQGFQQLSHVSEASSCSKWASLPYHWPLSPIKSPSLWKDVCKYGAHSLKCWNVWEILALLGSVHTLKCDRQADILTISAIFISHVMPTARVHVDSHFTDKAVHQKEKQRSTAWWVQAITSPSASTKGQNTRKESCERHKDSWFLFKVSISVDKHVSSSVIWAGNQGRGFSKKFYKTICSSEQRTLCPCLSAWRDLINLSITWNFCSGLIDGREYLPTTARVRM